jgi:hypothetical protein
MDKPRPIIRSPFQSIEEWSEWINETAKYTSDGNKTVLAGSGGRPATRDELIAFVVEQDARRARESGKE